MGAAAGEPPKLKLLKASFRPPKEEFWVWAIPVGEGMPPNDP